MGAKVLEPPTDEHDSLPDREPLFAAAVLAILASPDVVEVLSVDPYLPDQYVDDEDAGPMVREGPGFIARYRVRGTARVPTADRRRSVGQALVAANRERLGWALCFDPHYAVRAVRDGQKAEFLICFGCGNVQVNGPGSHAKMYPLGESAARLLRRELRAAGSGGCGSGGDGWAERFAARRQAEPAATPGPAGM